MLGTSFYLFVLELPAIKIPTLYSGPPETACPWYSVYTYTGLGRGGGSCKGVGGWWEGGGDRGGGRGGEIRWCNLSCL